MTHLDRILVILIALLAASHVATTALVLGMLLHL